MRHKVWVYNPYKQEKTISDQAKLRVQVRCDQFVLKYLRPRLARPFDSKNKKEAQCIDVQWKWYRHYIHFKAIYKDLRLDSRGLNIWTRISFIFRISGIRANGQS
ncbi:hypothetical protein A3E97_05080 [Candidatus Uhrbacteria bacterium RIFCSPHIGHO2_12_FULL_47_12]|nr:MAG: hypothetical protein UY62_C0050G0004 [Parcubacteria group bacterium GW2011_GWF2_50_9]OGL76274.1 MAG: hypothetical protein A3E97_05080 [Candidatus Uhrbacteria bacterium RIFCSPHIGHO2_12_FULL_47_12]OHA35494.1 MAG: hypothetical protein A2W65_04025 [Candidatus Taylorbacteria bacterium RIFCSPLOWO2_02_50_13]OHA46495.1 MAG: hypothetical protein A3G61_04050 [Candidatus Taylorbacteria bacterium RIFCSPLOWO2_12_FULL_49_67]